MRKTDVITMVPSRTILSIQRPIIMLTAFITYSSGTIRVSRPMFLDPEDGSQKATLVVFLNVVLPVLSGSKNPKAFLIRSGAQRNLAYIFVLTLPPDLPSQIFHSYFLINE